MGTVSISDGWVSGTKFSFTVSLTIEGSPMDVTFSGTLEGDQMKGTASGGGISVDFTGVHPSGTGAVAAAQEVE